MLVDMLKNHKAFQSLPYEQQLAYLKMANLFLITDNALFLSPDELAKQTQTGTPQRWKEFLSMEPVRQYIRSQIAFETSVAHRKALQSLQQQANEGNVQAIREINNLAQILNNIDDNKVVVLHHINRTPPQHQTNPKITLIDPQIEIYSVDTQKKPSEPDLKGIPKHIRKQIQLQKEKEKEKETYVILKEGSLQIELSQELIETVHRRLIEHLLDG